MFSRSSPSLNHEVFKDGCVLTIFWPHPWDHADTELGWDDPGKDHVRSFHMNEDYRKVQGKMSETPSSKKKLIT